MDRFDGRWLTGDQDDGLVRHFDTWVVWYIGGDDGGEPGEEGSYIVLFG